MARRKRPLFVEWQVDSEHVSRQIYRELEQYAVDYGYYPTQSALFALMTGGVWGAQTHEWIPPRYQFDRNKFDYWFERLVEEGYIDIDDRTRAIRSSYLDIREGENRPPELE